LVLWIHQYIVLSHQVEYFHLICNTQFLEEHRNLLECLGPKWTMKRVRFALFFRLFFSLIGRQELIFLMLTLYALHMFLILEARPHQKDKDDCKLFLVTWECCDSFSMILKFLSFQIDLVMQKIHQLKIEIKHKDQFIIT
jgi:hypothetical protein